MMRNILSFDFNLIYAIGALIILLFLSGWLEYRKNKNKYIIRRSIFMATALSGIALLIIKPKLINNQQVNQAILITPFSDEVTLDSLKRNIKNVAFYSDPYEAINRIEKERIEKIHVTGIGIDPSLYYGFRGVAVQSYPSELIPGIREINIPGLVENEIFQLKGKVNGDSIKSIFLLDPKGKEIKADLNQDNSFTIESKAGAPSRYKYLLGCVYPGNDTLMETLPIEIKEAVPWRLLLFADAPSFEINYLKNHWSAEMHGFALRLQISRDRYQTTFVNMPRVNINRLGTKELEGFDFIQMDFNSWNGIGSRSRNNILAIVNDRGKSLILKPSSIGQKAKNIPYNEIKRAKEIEVESRQSTLSLNQYEVVTSASWSPINHESLHIGMSTDYGLGKIAILSLGNTYQFILNDDADQYQNIWASFYSDLFLSTSSETRFQLPSWSWAGDESLIYLLSPLENQGSLRLNDEANVPLKASAFVEGIYSGKVWPKEGWNKISSSSDQSVAWFYAHKKESWSALRQEQLRSMSQHFQGSNGKVESLSSRSPLSFWWGLAIAILGFGLLWMDERMN